MLWVYTALPTASTGPKASYFRTLGSKDLKRQRFGTPRPQFACALEAALSINEGPAYYPASGFVYLVKSKVSLYGVVVRPKPVDLQASQSLGWGGWL